MRTTDDDGTDAAMIERLIAESQRPAPTGRDAEEDAANAAGMFLMVLFMSGALGVVIGFAMGRATL